MKPSRSYSHNSLLTSTYRQNNNMMYNFNDILLSLGHKLINKPLHVAKYAALFNLSAFIGTAVKEITLY